MTDSSKEDISEPTVEPVKKPFRSVFWDDLQEDLKDPEFAQLYDEETAKVREALK